MAEKIVVAVVASESEAADIVAEKLEFSGTSGEDENGYQYIIKQLDGCKYIVYKIRGR